MSQGSFTFAGVSSETLGLIITGADTYNIPNRRFDSIKIPGRSGNLIQDDGAFQNIDITYHAAVVTEGKGGANSALAALSTALMQYPGYQILRDTYHPGTYRRAVVKDIISVRAYRPQSGAPYRAAAFDIIFNCMPQRYRDDGEVAQAIGTTLTNPTGLPSAPLITVTSGAGNIIIGAQELTVLSGATLPLIIDCETMDAYTVTTEGKSNQNAFVILPIQDVRIYAGETTTSGSVSGTIAPKWYEI